MFFDAGGGHRAAATALKQVIENQQRPWDIRLIDVQDVLDELDIFRKLTGLRLEDIYNVLLEKRGWIDTEIQRLRETRVGADTLAQMLRRPEITYDILPIKDDSLPANARESVEIEIKYEGYIQRQIVDVERSKNVESKIIQANFEYFLQF